MTPHRIPKLVTVAIAPVQALAGLSWPSWAVAFGAGCGAFIRSDVIVGGLVIAAVLGILDYLIGYTRAKINGCIDQHVAQLGLLSKFAGIALVMGVRLMEWWLQESVKVLPDTDGLISAIICAGLIIRELHSLNDKGVRLPIVTQVLLGIESMLARLIPGQSPKRGEP